MKSSTPSADVAEYDFRDQRYANDPFGFWKEVRDTPGLARSEQAGGFLLASRYHEVRDAAKKEEVFCAGLGRALPPWPDRLLPADADGATHRRYRRLLNPWMSEKAMAPMEGSCRETCAEILEPLATRTSLDLCQEYANPAIVMQGVKWLGWPVEDAEQLGHWAHSIFSFDEATSVQSWQALSGWIAQYVERRRQERHDDIIQAVLDAEIDGQPITNDEVEQLILSIFLGAVDTTGSTLSYSLYWLAQHPEARDLLRSEPERLPVAVEEFLRVASTIVYLGRTVTRDTELRGCPVKAGDRVALMFGSANRDATVFPNPDEVVLDRQPNPHMAFGHGPHKCVGAPFARLMMRVGIEEALQRLGDFEVSDESLIAWETNQMRIFRRLPVTHRPR